MNQNLTADQLAAQFARAAREVDDAAVAFAKSREQITLLEQAVQAARRSLDIATIQYREGLVDFQRVLDSQRTLFSQQERLVTNRGNVSLSNLQVINAMLYVAEHGCKWRGLPKRFGNWHTIYTRMSRWAKAGVLDRVFERMQAEQLVRVRLEAVSLDSTIVKVHPDGTGARKKTARRPSAAPAEAGPPKFIWLPRIPAAR